MNKLRTYSELSLLKTFEERFKYLQLNGSVGLDTFAFERYLNQRFYNSAEWKRIRREVILRDNGCDLGVNGFDIPSRPVIHHMNPITTDDILEQTEMLLNPEYLVCVSHATHNAIHYGDVPPASFAPIERTPNDTCPWKKEK